MDRTLIHEFIHSLQNGRLFFKGKSIKGMMEGYTESYTVKICNESKVQYIRENEISYVTNYPLSTSYIENVSIADQLEIVIGEELTENLALYGKTDALKEIIQQYGIEFYEQIRKGLNKILRLNKKAQKIIIQQELQNTLLKVCYEKKYENVQNIQEALEFLKELKQIESKRIKIKEDTIFSDFYNKKYEQLIKRFSNIGNEEKLKLLKYS